VVVKVAEEVAEVVVAKVVVDTNKEPVVGS